MNIAWRHVRASTANKEATSLRTTVLNEMTCPETLLATTPETDFGQDSSKVASKLSLKTEPAGGHQPMDSCLVQNTRHCMLELFLNTQQQFHIWNILPLRAISYTED
ncbi:hypothetical protein E1A91_D09G137500v1 [Gossypium mustelinum]|uniref:Uncharacterized protein n=1 Tax=Gossypium mustelinum TaxID=34275 RepID=A0A5D2TKF8_GOSMU|nr:hypothetical protein E1A91_D09G137500v1 [Gossypium mustelinum]